MLPPPVNSDYAVERRPEATMLIDCDTCTVRDVECEDCVVTHLLASPPVVAGVTLPVRLNDDEAGALAVLADYGLVPPLRLAQGE